MGDRNAAIDSIQRAFKIRQAAAPSPVPTQFSDPMSAQASETPQQQPYDYSRSMEGLMQNTADAMQADREKAALKQRTKKVMPETYPAIDENAY